MGRNWLCVETELKEITSGFPEDISELIGVQRLAHKQGFSAEGTQKMFLNCTDKADLRRRLVLNTYPSVEDSRTRLERVGWVAYRWIERTSEAHRLILETGRETLTVEGETANEVWYRAVQQLAGSYPEVQGKPIMSSLTV